MTITLDLPEALVRQLLDLPEAQRGPLVQRALEHLSGAAFATGEATSDAGKNDTEAAEDAQAALPLSDGDLAALRQSRADMDAGRVQPFAQMLADVRQEFNVSPIAHPGNAA